MTPTISRQGLAGVLRSRLPMAWSGVFQNSRASVSLITTTGSR